MASVKMPTPAELKQVGAEPAADFKQAFTAEVVEFHQRPHEGLRAVAESLDFIEKFLRSPFKLGKLRAAWVGVPVLAYLGF